MATFRRSRDASRPSPTLSIVTAPEIVTLLTPSLFGMPHGSHKVLSEFRRLERTFWSKSRRPIDWCGFVLAKWKSISILQNPVPRKIEEVLRRRLGAYPAVALLGPRQSGKTTLARSLGGRYFDLQQEPDQLRVDLEWDGLIVGRELVVLDEVQVWPDLFPRLRGAIDQDQERYGHFPVLGSVSPALMTQVSESLAGRLSLTALTPFPTSERSDPADCGCHWLLGGRV